ncbi:MAG: hypothetical protein AAF125_08295 [Chloroflexota bacterium]
MSLTEITLMITLLTASFFVGVIAAMIGVIQRVLDDLDYPTYTRVMQEIITSGRQSIVIWSLLLIPTFSAGFALFLLRNATAEPTFARLIVGLALFIIGPILVSGYGNEPYYDDVMTWRTEQAVFVWKHKRRRWFWLNLVRFTIGALACVAMAVALVLSAM